MLILFPFSMSGNNPAISAQTAATDVKRTVGRRVVAYDVLDGHIDHCYTKIEPIGTKRVNYKPGENIRFQIPNATINPLDSWIQGVMRIAPINCDLSVYEVNENARLIFGKTMRSRPGATFQQHPYPITVLERTFDNDFRAHDVSIIRLMGVLFTEKELDETKATIQGVTMKKANAYTAHLLQQNKLFNGLDAKGDEYSSTAVFDINIPSIYDMPYGYSKTEEIFSTTALTKANEDPFYALNSRADAMTMNFEADMYHDFRLFDSYVDRSIVTPDESIAAWDPLSFNWTHNIMQNFKAGVYMRNILQLFSYIHVGTASRETLIENNSNPGLSTLMNTLDFENDAFDGGSDFYWSLQEVIRKFKWQGPGDLFTNILVNNTVAVENAIDGFYYKRLNGAHYNSFSNSSSTLATTTTRGLIPELNTRPFRSPAIFVPFKIPLNYISGFFNDDYLPHDDPIDPLVINMRLNNMGDVLDYGKYDGFDHKLGDIIDTTSFGNAADYIRNILKITNWGGWDIVDFSMYCDILDIKPEWKGVYDSMLQGGDERAYNTYDFIPLKTIRAEELPSPEVPTIVRNRYLHPITSGTISMVNIIPKLRDTCMSLTPFFDRISIQIGTSPYARNYPAESHRTLTLNDCHKLLMKHFNKTDSHITNMNTDFISRYGVPSYRTKFMTKEFWYNDDYTPASMGGAPIYVAVNSFLSPSSNSNRSLGITNSISDVRLDPMHAYSTSVLFDSKKLHYEDSCIIPIDLRGDAPTPGTAPNAIMSGINTNTVQNMSLSISTYTNDLSISQRFGTRQFDLSVMIVRDVVAKVSLVGSRLAVGVKVDKARDFEYPHGIQMGMNATAGPVM